MRRSRQHKCLTVAMLSSALLLVASPALADPAKPSNYVSQLLEVPSSDITLEVQGGDAYIVLEVAPGVEVIVPGYPRRDDQPIDEIEVYLRVLADGTVQLNRNSEAYYLNAGRYGGTVPAGAGVDAAPDWETVASDGRVAWHDHRVHWMSPLPPRQVDIDAAGPQRVDEFLVPMLVNGELVVAEGTLDYVKDSSPIPVILAFVVAFAAGVVIMRRNLRLGAVLAFATGGAIIGLLVAAGTGRAAGFDLATPPLALAAVGAVAPLLGATVRSLTDGQRKGLIMLGGIVLTLFGILSTGALDALVGGQDGGFGSWWLRPTLPADVAPGVLRLAIASATGVGIAVVGIGAMIPTAPADQLPDSNDS